MRNCSGKKNAICDISISYQLEADNLVGGKYEYNPYVESRATFGAYKIEEKDTLILIEEKNNSPIGLSAEKKNNDKKKKKKKKSKNNDNDDDEEEEEKSKLINVNEEAIHSYLSSKPLKYELPDYQKMRGDDAFHFKLFSHTRFSGVESIDKSDAKYVERQIPSGLCSLTLYDIFTFYNKACEESGEGEEKSFLINGKFYDDKVIDEKTRELLKEKHRHKKVKNVTEEEYTELKKYAKPLTEKASITFTVTVHNFNKTIYRHSIFNNKDLKNSGLHAFLPTAAPLTRKIEMISNSYNNDNNDQQQETCTRFSPLLFNSTESWKKFMQTTEGFLEVYCKNFIATSDNYKCLFSPVEESTSNLQLAQYVSEFGRMPIFAYFGSHDPFFRQYSSKEAKEADLKLYGFDDKTEVYFLMLLRSSLRRHGISEETFIKCITEHFSPENTSGYISPYFVIAEEVVASIGTFAANTAYYTADYRFMNTSTSLQHNHKDQGDTHRCSRCKKQMKFKVVNLDSWDSGILNNTSMCDDCEGQDDAATCIIRSFFIGCYKKGFKWSHPALSAVQKYLSFTAITDTGALVTSAFFDTNNKKIETKQEELPLIGSKMDKDCENAGHCFGLTNSLTRTIEMLDNGNTHKSIIKRMKDANTINAAFKIRDNKRTTLVLEPTGSIEPRILSLEESYDAKLAGFDVSSVGNFLYDKRKAEWSFMKHLKLRLKEEKLMETVADIFVCEGVCHYVNKQTENRRVSSFYNSMVHGSSIDLMNRFDVTLSQFAFCKKINNQDCYGIRTGELIRHNPKSKISLICPFNDYKKTWVKDVLPMVESITNQMAISKFGRYSDKEYAEEVYSRFISPSKISASFDFYAKEEEAVTTEQLRFEEELAKVEALDSNRTIARLYSRTWKLNQDASKTSAFVKFVSSMPGLISHAYYLEKHIPVCEPIVVILCIIDVKKALSLRTTEK